MLTEDKKMYGKKIRYYRLKQGKTIEDIAEAVGCTKAAISQYENDKRDPDFETSNKIASFLGVSWLDFITDSHNTLIYKHRGFRKKQSVNNHDIELLKIEIEELLADRYLIQDILGDADDKHFRRRALSLNAAPSYNAMLVRRHIGVNSSGPLYSITRTLEDLGVFVISFPCESDIDGLNGWVNDIPYIYFNSKRTIESQRFTIVHELCHLLFIPLMDSKEREKLVNSVAGRVLISDEDIYREFGRTNHNISPFLRDSVAKKYKIAPSCLVTRLFESGVVTEQYYRSFFKKLNATVGRKNEPSLLNEKDDSETPVKYVNQVYLALSNEMITMSKAASMLKVPLYDVVRNVKGVETN